MTEQFDAAYWEDRHRHHLAGGHEPSAHLMTEVGGLAPGRALEAGCGEGANALWLAERGWSVTAVDVSPTALARARARVGMAPGEVASRIEWVQADLTAWLPGPGGFDLVSSHYVHPAGGWHALVAGLSSAVSDGGTLLVVDHDHGDGHADVHVAPGELAVALPAAEWTVEVAEARTRRAGHEGVPTTLRDAVLRARRVS